jgi:hypothetical protein
LLSALARSARKAELATYARAEIEDYFGLNSTNYDFDGITENLKNSFDGMYWLKSGVKGLVYVTALAPDEGQAVGEDDLEGDRRAEAVTLQTDTLQVI